jgi:hypothetical protein
VHFVLSHDEHQLALLCDVMAPGHPCIPSVLPFVLDVLPSDCPKLSREPPPPMVVLEEEGKILVCAV